MHPHAYEWKSMEQKVQSDRPFMESNLVAYGSKETIEETILKYILIKK